NAKTGRSGRSPAFPRFARVASWTCACLLKKSSFSPHRSTPTGGAGKTGTTATAGPARTNAPAARTHAAGAVAVPPAVKPAKVANAIAAAVAPRSKSFRLPEVGTLPLPPTPLALFHPLVPQGPLAGDPRGYQPRADMRLHLLHGRNHNRSGNTGGLSVPALL